MQTARREWTTPVLEVARMDAATCGTGQPGVDDHDGDGITDVCDEDFGPVLIPELCGGAIPLS